MGLASKVNSGGPPPGGAPPGAAPSAPPAPGGHFPPPGQGAPSGYPPVQGQFGAPGGAAPPSGQFGAPPPGQQSGGYPGQAPPRPGQQPSPYGGPPQSGQFGAPPPSGQQPPRPGYPQVGGPPQGQFGAAPQGQYPGQQGGQFPGQSGAPPPYGGAPQQPHGGANAAYAGTGGLMGPPGSAGAVMPIIQQKLQKMVQVNRLEQFYPPQQLQRVLARLDCVNFKALSAKWNMPLELATDLSQLALYDICIFADDSGSMVFEERGERVDDLKLILSRIAEVATLFDDDGILVRFMNNNVEGNGITSEQGALQLVNQIQFNGMTPLGTNLDRKIIQPFLMSGIQKRDLQKPILCIVITDGEPVGEPHDTVKRVIVNAKHAAGNSPYGPGAIAFEFAQVGKDQKAQRFLGDLDNDPSVGNIIDATSYFELEAEEYRAKGVVLTPELWLVKLMCGAIDPTYDEQD